MGIDITSSAETLRWGHPKGYAVLLPPEPKWQRNVLPSARMPELFPDGPTTDTAYLTPPPTEYPSDAAHLPGHLKLILPYRGTGEVGAPSGYQTTSWTHQTIANVASANDFFAIDFLMPVGTPVVAAADGTIITSTFRSDTYGGYIALDHGGGYHSIYAHLDSMEHQVLLGEPYVEVKQGDLIGYSGSTGTTFPHLHFAVHHGAWVPQSGASIGGKAVVPEPLGGYYGIRRGQVLTSPDGEK